MHCSRVQPIKRLLEFEAGDGLTKGMTKQTNPWWSFDLKEGCDLSWKPQKISGRQKKVGGKIGRCYNWHNEGRRTDKNHINKGTKYCCVEFGHDDFSLNVEEDKKEPKIKVAHGNNV